MNETTGNYLICAHCGGTGTCKSGENDLSCAVCVKEHKVKKSSHGLVCSVCGGIGKAEMKTERINRRLTSILALLIVYVALFMVLLLALFHNEHFNQILAFAGTLIGSITGYYFAGRRLNGT